MDPNSLLAEILGGTIPLLILCSSVVAVRIQKRRQRKQEEVREYVKSYMGGPTVLDWLRDQYSHMDDSKFSLENFEDALNQFEDVLDAPISVIKPPPPKRHSGPIWASTRNAMLEGISKDYDYASGSTGPIPLVGGGTVAGSGNASYGARSLEHFVTTGMYNTFLGQMNQSLMTANEARAAMEKLTNEPADHDV